MKRVLWLSPRQCWPPDSGAKLREYYLARALGRSAPLVQVFFAQAGAPLSAKVDLPFCERRVAVPSPAKYTPGKVLRGLFGRWPLSVVNYTSRDMMQALEGLSGEAFDLVHLDSIHMAAYEPLLHRLFHAPIIYNWHNIESELMRRHASIEPSPARKLYAAVTARRLERLELRLLASAAGHIVCSERERNELQKLAAQARIAVVENGVDTEYFAPSTSVDAGARRNLVFVGSMNYSANVEAAVAFTRQIWPLVRQRFPEAKLLIVGANPTAAVRALAAESRVEVTGTVADVRPYYREALAAIVPLRTGGGTRLKILEAMASGVPVVSTAIGAEGLAVSEGANILFAESPEDWLAQIGALSNDGKLWARLSEGGLQLVRSRYDWAAIGTLLVTTYEQWLAAP